MSHSASPLAAFHLIGDRAAIEPLEAKATAFQPALFGNYHDLTRLRTDYPVVLLDSAGSDGWIRSLSDVIDQLLQAIAEPGTGGEETRRQVLALEQVMRKQVAEGCEGTLLQRWDAAREELTRGEGDSSPSAQKLDAALRQAGEALSFDGELIGFSNLLAARLVKRAWRESERSKSERLLKRIDRLAQMLSDILKVNEMQSPGARQAEQLERAVGSGDRNVFDFQAMAQVLRSAPRAEPLPANRQQRIQSAIEVLNAQRFFRRAGQDPEAGVKPHEFSFDDCESATRAFTERLPEMAALIKAISIAELEIDNHYSEDRHDHFFNRFDAQRLGPLDLESFPSYLVCIGQTDEAARQQILRTLRCGLPFKIVAQTDDILGEDNIAGGQLSFGTQGQQLARMALGLDQAFVLQSASSSLYQLKDHVFSGVSNNGSALFSIYSGAGYLETAAANESRAFPCFVCDPGAGNEQAARFSLAGNPSLEEDWCRQTLGYESPGHDYQSENTAFTLVDFVSQFPRFAGRFACIPRSGWSDEMVGVPDFLELSGRERADKVPFVPVIDSEDRLMRAVVDEKLLDAADRCLSSWHVLQEMGGVNNSHAAAAVTRAKAAWEAEYVPPLVQPEKPAAAAAETPAPAEKPVTEPVAAATAEEPAQSSDDPWIETIRCTTCNECTQLNDRMFAYDGEKRAYVKDPDAGTYRELVEAAETCQVAIIHPGKPRNPDEPGLAELLERAKPFL